jgi:hypothetical protein
MTLTEEQERNRSAFWNKVISADATLEPFRTKLKRLLKEFCEEEKRIRSEVEPDGDG